MPRWPASSSSRRRLGVALVVGAAAASGALAPACHQEDYGDGVVLEIRLPTNAQDGSPSRPAFLELDWLDGTHALFKARRVPESGNLPDDGRPYIAKIVVALNDPMLTAFGGTQDAVVRRAVVHASLGNGKVLVGRRRFEARLGYIVPIDTTIFAEAELPTIDGDGDGVPNDVDACPGTDDFIGCTPSGADGGPRDASADVRDGAADAPAVDAPVHQDASGSRTDGGADAAGDGRAFAEVVAPPEAPSDLKVTSVKATEVQLAWTDHANDETGFVVERVVAGTFQQVGTTAANKTTYTDAALARNTAYTYQVRAERAQVQSPPSSPVSITTTN
jgi:hypothetical protein